jgi:hypothetical protein
MALNIDLKRFAAYNIVGYGTEVQNLSAYSPHFAGGNSGWSFGVTQIDLGQPANYSKANQLAVSYGIWQASEAAAGRTWPAITAADISNPGGKSLSIDQKKALAALSSTGTGRALVDSWDANNVKALLGNGLILDGTANFGNLSAKDQFIVLSTAMKVDNQTHGISDITNLLNGNLVTRNGQTFQIGVSDTSAVVLQKIFDLTQSYKDPAARVGAAKAYNKAGVMYDIYNSASFADARAYLQNSANDLSGAIATPAVQSQLSVLRVLSINAAELPIQNTWLRDPLSGNKVIYNSSTNRACSVDSAMNGYCSINGKWQAIQNGKTIDGNVIVDKRIDANGKSKLLIIGLDNSSTGYLVTENGVTLLGAQEATAALLASDLAGGDIAGARGLLDSLVSATTVKLASIGPLTSSIHVAAAINGEMVALRNAWANDPNSSVTTDASGQLTIKTGGSTYLLADNGLLSRLIVDANGYPNGMSILTGGSAGQSITFNASGNTVLTDAQAQVIGSNMVNNLVTTGNPIATGGAIAPGNFDGVIKATLTEMGTGSILADLTVQNIWTGGAQVGSIATNYTHSTGITTQTVDTTLSGNAVNVTYTYDTVTGQPIPHVNSINGQPPTDQAGADAALLKSGVLPGQLMYGDSGVAGTNAGGVVATFDAVHPSGMQTLANTLVDVGNAVISYAPPLIDAMSFLKAIQTRQPLPVVASGLRIANDLTSMRVPVDPNNPNGATYLKPTSAAINGAASVAGGFLSVMSLDAALKRGDTLGAVVAGAHGASAYVSLTAGTSATEASISAAFPNAGGAINGLNTALPYLNIVNSIVNGDAVGAAMGAIAMTPAAPVAWAYYAFSMITSLFGDTPAIPAPWGNGRYVWNGTGVTLAVAGQTGGDQVVSSFMNQMLGSLNTLIAQEEQQNPGSVLGIVASRMPSLNYGMQSYNFTDIDPLIFKAANDAVFEMRRAA